MFLALSAVFINESPPHYPVGAIHNISIIAAITAPVPLGGPALHHHHPLIFLLKMTLTYIYGDYTVYSKVGEVVSNNYKMRGVFRILL